MRTWPGHPHTAWVKGFTGIAVCVILFACLSGCEPKTRYKALSIFFDGVPNPEEQSAEQQTGISGGSKTLRPTYREHGPYAAKMCDACHDKATNELKMPIEKLCFNCHLIQMDKKYVHGPVAAGGCRVCHDPHGSSFPYLLVSEPRTFCFHCHDEKAVFKNEVHKGVDAPCTACHDAHSSNNRFLLK